MQCTLFLLLIPLCRPLIIRWWISVSRICAAFWITFREMEICLWILLCHNFGARESYAFLFWRELPSERQNAVHRCSGFAHLLSRFPLAIKWVLWFALFTFATDAFFFVGFFYVPFSLSWGLVKKQWCARLLNVTWRNDLIRRWGRVQCSNVASELIRERGLRYGAVWFYRNLGCSQMEVLGWPQGGT